MKIGIGYDIHRLARGRKLFLGGIEIPHEKGLEGYSDGDAALHAIADAILGAIPLGDIGAHFPDTDPKFKGIRSTEIVRIVAELARMRRFEIVNIDVVILAQAPRISSYRDKMVEAISLAAGVKKDAVNVKATTNEGVGAIGRAEAIAAYAVALLE